MQMSSPVVEAEPPLTSGSTQVGSPWASRWRLARHASTRIPKWILVLFFYLTLAVLTIGRYAITNPRTVCACVGTGDPAAFMWSLAWWPHAISHGLNPFVSHYLWSPTGVNLAQAAMIPTAAIAMSPFTALFGQTFSYNLLAIFSPALAAFTSSRECMRSATERCVSGSTTSRATSFINGSRAWEPSAPR